MTLGRRIAVALVALTVTALGIAVCGWEFFNHQIRANEHAPKLVRVHSPAEDFAFKTLDGSPKRLSDFKGKTVFLDLWGTWCIQCVAEMPTVQKLYDHYRHDPDVVFLIVSRLDSPGKVRLYAKSNGYDLPFYTMEDADIPRSMEFNQYPATFLFGPDGYLVANHVGAADWSAPSVASFIEKTRTQH